MDKGVLEMTNPILITGCARSGTSMVAGIVNICGAFGGTMSGPTEFNKKGMFENACIRNNIMKPYLKGIKCDPLGQDPLPKPFDGLPLFEPDLKVQVKETMKDEGYESGSWFYKGAKMCLIWPLWNLAFPKAKWIIVRRRDEDIINSCMHTNFMRAYNNVAGWQKWVDTHKERFEEMKCRASSITEIWPEQFVEHGDFSHIRKVVEEYGLEWKKEEIEEFITPAWWSVKRRDG